jgi:hypothetical protein
VRKKILLLPILVIISFTSVKAQEVKSGLMVVGTIHGAHNMNPNYSYDSLYNFIEKYNPDIIGVEIRKEDMDSSVAYLKRNYPFEMYDCISRYPEKLVLGFDWLGDDIAGKAIPSNYWKEISSVKKLEQQLFTDTVMLKKLAVIEIVRDEKIRIVLHSSLEQLNDMRYDLINRIYYKQLELMLKDTKYASLTDFYKKRDEMIAQNILEIVKNNPGKKIIFLLGIDHRDLTATRLKNLINN